MYSPFRLIPQPSIIWLLPLSLFACGTAAKDNSKQAGASIATARPHDPQQPIIEQLPDLSLDQPQLSTVLRLSERDADPGPNAQGNYYAFSGAVYIVASNGQQLNAASPAYCPNSAPVGCGNIGIWNWCCQSGSTCAWADSAHSVVGCCPNGQYCNGTPNQNTIQTVTVYITTTAYAPLVTTNNPVVVVGVVTTTPYQTVKTVLANGGYCTTIVMQADGLPTTGKAPCGTAYIVNVGVRPLAKQILTAVGLFWIFVVLALGLFGVWRW